MNGKCMLYTTTFGRYVCMYICIQRLSVDHVHIYIYINICGHPPPPPHDPPVFKNSVICSTFCLLLLSTILRSSFSIQLLKKYVFFSRFSGQKPRIICVLAHFKALNRENSIFSINTLSHAAICCGNLLPAMLRLSKTTRDQKAKKTKSGSESLVSAGFLEFLV